MTIIKNVVPDPADVLAAEREAAIEEIVQIEERKRLNSIRETAAAEIRKGATLAEIENTLQEKRLNSADKATR